MAFKQLQFDANASIDDINNLLEQEKGIIFLGIQASPGTIFSINDSNYDTIIGNSGILQLDLNKTKTIINSIKCKDNKTIYEPLLIDIVYV